MRRVRMRPKRRAAASADAEPSASPKASARPRRALVREVAGATGAIDALSSRLGMVVLALGCGFAVGVVVSLLLRATTAVTDLVWKGAASLFPVPWFALLACTVGGLVIGLWTWWSAERVHSLEEVMGEFRRTGSFRTRGLLRPTVSFLLPLAFGGSVGFEAGLTGIITSACCWVRDRLKAAGLRVAVVADVTIAACVSAIFATPLAGIVCGVEGGHAAPDPDGALPAEADSAVDDFELARGAKVVLYAAAAVGALGGLVATGAVLGPSGGLPRFEAIGAHGVELAWVVPCIALGWLLSIVHHASARLFSRAAKALAPSGERSLASVVLPPVACGIVLGAVACALPYVLFPGEVQSEELMASWAAMGAPVLIATGRRLWPRGAHGLRPHARGDGHHLGAPGRRHPKARGHDRDSGAVLSGLGRAVERPCGRGRLRPPGGRAAPGRGRVTRWQTWMRACRTARSSRPSRPL